MFRAICLDDTNKPNEIPQHKWIVKGNIYHIIHVSKHTKQNMIQGVTLSEINLDESCKPYEAFRLSRFGIFLEDFDKFCQFAMECTELSKIEINELLKEVELIEK